MFGKRGKKSRPGFGAVEVFTTLFLIFTIVFCIVVVAQIMSNGYVKLCGYSLFRVETGSMEPTISTGALLICKEADMEDIAVKDIICYRSQSKQMLGQVITHRVVEVLESSTGQILLETRGDANTVSDGFFVASNNLVGKVVWYSGQKNILAGVIGFVTGRIGFFGCIVIPVLLVSGLLLRDSVKDIQKELKELEALEYQTGLKLWEDQEGQAELTAAEPFIRRLDGVTPESAQKQTVLVTTEHLQMQTDLMTQEEYNALVQRLKAEIMEELIQSAEGQTDRTES